MEWLMKKTIYRDEYAMDITKGPLHCDEFFLELYNTICHSGTVFIVIEKLYFLEANFPIILYGNGKQPLFNYDEDKHRYLSHINLQVPLGIAILGFY